MLKWCQMPSDEGLNECGFLIGNVCKANHDHEFRITADFLRCLKIIGCQSWQEHIDFDEREKRFGHEAVRDGKSTEKRTATCEADRRVHEMQELSELEMGSNRGCGNEGRTVVPMHILQEDSDNERHTKDNRSIGDHMKHIQCFICGKNATTSHKGIWLCADHLERTMNGMSLKEQKDKEEKK